MQQITLYITTYSIHVPVRFLPFSPYCNNLPLIYHIQSCQIFWQLQLFKPLKDSILLIYSFMYLFSLITFFLLTFPSYYFIYFFFKPWLFYFPFYYYWIHHPFIIPITWNLLSPWVLNECHKQKMRCWSHVKHRHRNHKYSNLLSLQSYMINYAPRVLYSCKRHKEQVLVSTGVTSNSIEKQTLKKSCTERQIWSSEKIWLSALKENWCYVCTPEVEVLLWDTSFVSERRKY